MELAVRKGHLDIRAMLMSYGAVQRDDHTSGEHSD